jgi:hypothetical protein
MVRLQASNHVVTLPRFQALDLSVGNFLPGVRVGIRDAWVLARRTSKPFEITYPRLVKPLQHIFDLSFFFADLKIALRDRRCNLTQDVAPQLMPT